MLFSFSVSALFLWAALFLCSRPLAAALCAIIASQSADWSWRSVLFASGGLFSFSSERKEEKKRRQKLRFWISLRGFTRFLSCQNKPRERCAAQISPKCCIVSASWSAAAFTLKCRCNRFCRGGGQRQRKEKQRCDFSAPSGRGLAARSADWGRERKAYYLSLRRFAPPPSQREAEDADCHGRDAPSQ